MAKILDSGDEKLFRGALLFNAKILGLIFGFLFGLAVFIATNWLVIRGGHLNESGDYVVGPHLQLLSQFFIGYRVSFVGSVIGFGYAFALGTFSGFLFAGVYNKIVELRNCTR